MVRTKLSKQDSETIDSHVRAHALTLALLRTELSPKALEPLLRSLGESCGVSLSRVFSSPTSGYGMAELDSKDKILIVLFVLGEHTELISVSETDEVFIKDLEESIRYSNFFSDIMQEGT